MEDQVTTIEQSRRLMELGVPEEKASMVWDRIGKTQCYPCQRPFARGIGTVVSVAYTVADLLGMMPKNIGYDRSLCLYIEGTAWTIEWVDGDFCEGRAADTNLIGLLCNRIEWLVSNGYKLEV